jgi:shikimate dehydrogenase
MAQSFTEFKTGSDARQPHFLVIGNPIGHSLSPLMHQFALDYHGIDAVYKAVQLKPDEIGSFTAWVNRDQFLGCNITIPYKEHFAGIADHLDDDARAAGVINTLAKSGHSLNGHNTDIYGFLQPLYEYEEVLEGGRAIIFGTGGASRAVEIALAKLGMEELIFVSRNPSNKQNSSSQLYTQTVHYSQWQAYADEAVLFVNTTPLGMHPNVGASPVDGADAALLSGKICYDLIYNPLQTTFLRQAEKAGAEMIDGLQMFIWQGNRSFEIWTGKSFPVDDIRKLLVNELQV